MPDHTRGITSVGDLEVAFLYECHDLLATLVGPDYYGTLGSPPSEVRFHSEVTFGGFFAHVDELFATGDRIKVPGLTGRLSLFDVGEWFVSKYPEEARANSLDTSQARLREWARASPTFKFWSGELGRHIEFPLSRQGMIYYLANLHKHRLLRLGSLLTRLGDLCHAHGIALRADEIVAIRESFSEELHSRLEYLASWLTELLGAYFLAVNSIIVHRYRQAGTNEARKMRMPDGVTSDLMRDLYSSTLVFRSYPAERITRFTPVVPTILKERY
jgi:hypothetical protein